MDCAIKTKKLSDCEYLSFHWRPSWINTESVFIHQIKVYWLIFEPIQFNCTPFDSPFKTLFKVCWVQFDLIKRSVVKFQKTDGDYRARHLQGSLLRDFGSRKLLQSRCTEKKLCRTLQELSIDIKWFEIWTEMACVESPERRHVWR